MQKLYSQGIKPCFDINNTFSDWQKYCTSKFAPKFSKQFLYKADRDI